MKPNFHMYNFHVYIETQFEAENGEKADFSKFGEKSDSWTHNS